MKLNTLLIFSLLLALILAGCDSSNRKEKSKSQPAGPSQTPAAETHPILVKDITAYVEVVYTNAKRLQGLMFRESLAPDHGMIFLFPEEKIQSFWMKNTLLPLSIAYINQDGYIVNIEYMTPEGNVSDWRRKNYPSKMPAKYALEMEYGWFQKNGISPGDQVVLPESIHAITPR